ncbi:xanthine dehydrogenase 1-like isoform X2 [Pyrus x bretschneideri]|nr:xanthine dehydrogenase 1-like isoform X2 [Pyrus x bretschneideri]XP_048444792.1 xanthine dehydrogenase 1-like isoform X2 [Pyrus x bretschneideri]
MVSHYNKELKKSFHYAVNACLAPLYSVEGMHVITVEGLGSHKQGLHPIQESLARSHGSQCGFCTPGFIMSIYALLRSSQKPPSEEQIEECLAGNLCRCTGYRPIVDAFRVFSKTNDTPYINTSALSSEGGEFVCPSTGKPCSCGLESESSCITHESGTHRKRYAPVSYSEIDGSTYTDKEFIFPPELLLRKSTYLSLTGFGGLKWFRPLRLQQVLELKEKYPDAKLLVGNTEVGIETRLKKIQYKVLIFVTHVPELSKLTVKDDGIEIGSAVRLSELLKVLRTVITERTAHETSACKALVEQLKWFAGVQIRNVASVGGNICTASPISDLNPLWMASRAKFQIIDCKGNIRTTLAENFFLGYRKVDLAGGEILLSVFLPWTRSFEYVKEYKQAHRRDDDIAIVNAGIRVHLEDRGGWVVSDASIAYGGVAPLSLSATRTKNFLIGKSWNQEMLQGALKVLQEDVLLKDDAPGGMVEFRKSLSVSFFFKFFLWVSQQMEGKHCINESVPLSHLSAVQSFHRSPVIGAQDYEVIKRGTAVGSPEVHLSARLQVTGEAEYADDTPLPPNGLHAALILSRKPHARIHSIDDSGAKLSPGFAGIYLAKDVPADNNIGPVVEDEELFASEFVTCVGQARFEVDQFNIQNRWRKRGIAMVPTKFGIAFTLKLMNQAGALVHVYTDGTVLVTQGGVEMGQGLHTKVAQVAASAFNIPLSSVFISETSTDKVPNASPTSASASSDIYGAAVLDACEKIKACMKPIASQKNFSSFAELASACYVERIDLSAHGFYITPENVFDWTTGKGNPFNYFTYGAAFAEVEIDTLTGDFHTRAANVFLDLGYSLNPAIDVGQIEGAFLQGLGWVALEELKWGDPAHKWISPGCLYMSGPGNYKIPSINDVPFKFSVSLLKGHPNVKAIHSSKAVGEPPFFLASAVFFAIKDAIIAAREEVGSNEWFPLDNPATPERIRMACLDEIIEPFVSTDFGAKLSV